jgi:hypothetical protein
VSLALLRPGNPLRNVQTAAVNSREPRRTTIERLYPHPPQRRIRATRVNRRRFSSKVFLLHLGMSARWHPAGSNFKFTRNVFSRAHSGHTRRARGFLDRCSATLVFRYERASGARGRRFESSRSNHRGLADAGLCDGPGFGSQAPQHDGQARTGRVRSAPRTGKSPPLQVLPFLPAYRRVSLEHAPARLHADQRLERLAAEQMPQHPPAVAQHVDGVVDQHRP